MQKNTRKGRTTHFSGALDGLDRSLQSAIHTNQYCSADKATESQVSQRMISSLLPYMEKKRVMNRNGNVLSERIVSYLAGIIPYFSSVELKKLENDPKSFVEKFCVQPDSIDKLNETTLALDLFYRPDRCLIFGKFDKPWIDKHQNTFQRFQEYTYNAETQSCCSPFELVPKDLLDEFYTETGETKGS